MRRRNSYTMERALAIIADRLAKERTAEKRPVLYLPGNAGRIARLEDWIFENAGQISGTDIFQVLALGSAAGWANVVMNDVGIVTPFIGPGVRDLVNKGLARNIRRNLSQVPRLFTERWRPDVAIAHTSAPDMSGLVTLGLNAGIDIGALKYARFKVAVVNRQMPRWHIGIYQDPHTSKNYHVGCAMDITRDFDLVVEVDEPLIEHPFTPNNGADAAAVDAIANNILEFLSKDARSRDKLPHTLQLGIGTIPNAFANALAERKCSIEGIWSELFSDGVLRLFDEGLIEKTDGLYLRDRIVVGIVLGTQELYERMHENPCFAVLPQEIVNDPAMIRHNKRTVSVNSAIAVSLNGEVSASTIGKCYYSDVGGQFDFALGATWAEKGIAIIALPSTAELRDGSVESKIVSTHSEGAHHTISADLPVVVATEYGMADLRDKNDTERVDAMINIAHPNWRSTLAKTARTHPSMQGVGVMPPKLLRLKNGDIAILRTATVNDIPALQRYIQYLSDDDRRTRYMGAVSVSVLTSSERMKKIYHDTLEFRSHAAFIIEVNNEIVGVAHALQTGKEGVYEISFSRRSDFYGRGIGGILMRALIEWGIATGVQCFEAITYRTENPRMRALFDRFKFVPSPDPDDPMVVDYSATLADLAQVQHEPAKLRQS